ncbi:hypothetical protein GCM10010273_56310 [Streptomyces lavendulocolor]
MRGLDWGSSQAVQSGRQPQEDLMASTSQFAAVSSSVSAEEAPELTGPVVIAVDVEDEE